MSELQPAESGRSQDAQARAAATAGAGSAYHVVAASCAADDRTRVLKHGDTFAVFDRHGDIKPGGLGEEGLYHDGTRFLSCLLLDLERTRPFLLGSTIRDENDQLSVDLTNPDLLDGDRVRTPLGTLHLALKTFLWQGACYRRLRVKNHGLVAVDTALHIHFAADFADIFEVRGMKRRARGHDLVPEVSADRVILGYRGLDGVVRRTVLWFSPAPARLTANGARLDLPLGPGQAVELHLSATCERGPGPSRHVTFGQARAGAEAELERFRAWSGQVRSANGQFDAWVRRAVSDLHMLTTELPTGPYPYAGVPWFNTPFGRDGIITALECLWIQPELARGVLAYLAATQATLVIPEQDAEPGKVLHETRNGEMAVLREMPFGRYYGSVDATPLFVALAGAYYERTGDRTFVESIWPNVEAALHWVERSADRNGFVAYRRRSADGLIHQGWKDSDDAIAHADGSPVEGPVALCEVQGYVYAAWRAGAALAGMLGHAERARQLAARAEALREAFDRAFWCDDLSTYALALDGSGRPCRVRTSNAGQCLFTGIVAPARARRLAETLMGPASFCGWGVRTLDAGEARYNPMSYHNGSVWPHDNALIALGLARCGLGEHAGQILTGLFEAGLGFDLQRMPELFCGFERRPGEGPVLYPVACAPQAWAAASVFLLLQASLGLELSAPARRICFTRPRLPDFLPEVRVSDLKLAGASVDLLLVRHGDDVGINVLRRDGDVHVLLVK
jgi:glycogen debranching enzyme